MFRSFFRADYNPVNGRQTNNHVQRSLKRGRMHGGKRSKFLLISHAILLSVVSLSLVAVKVNAVDVVRNILRGLAELPRDLAATPVSGNKFNGRAIFGFGEHGYRSDVSEARAFSFWRKTLLVFEELAIITFAGVDFGHGNTSVSRCRANYKEPRLAGLPRLAVVAACVLAAGAAAARRQEVCPVLNRQSLRPASFS